MKRKAQTVLVTGASGGIGLELANVFAHHGYDLILVARNESKLHEIANTFQTRFNTRVKVLAADLSYLKTPRDIAKQLQAENLTVDILVNNAGFANYGAFATNDEQKELDLLKVNVTAPTHLTKLFLPPMLQRGRGKILNVASTAAFQPGPLMAVYYASKAYVLSFSEALSEELDGSDVTVTCLCPGATISGFQERAAMTKSKLMQNISMDAATVAREGYRALMRGQRVAIPGTKSQLFALTPRILPRSWAAKIVRRLQEEI
jgi:short-subunit dehydrogenase